VTAVFPPTYPPIPLPRLHERIVQRIVQQIVSGAMLPGTSLPIEPELAQQFGVSRTVVREAVRLLVAKGLVAVKQGSGMRVEPFDRWDHLDPMLIFEQVKAGKDATLLEELIEMRRVIETEIASLAAGRRTWEDVISLEEILDGMAAAVDDPEEYTRYDVAFHDALLIAARNRLLREALRPVSAALWEGRRIAVHRPSVIRHSLPSHRAIFKEVKAGDAAGAREAMRRHVLEFEEDIRAGLRALGTTSGRPAARATGP
jgi:DNA-binding FadR family transcriptional regulator